MTEHKTICEALQGDITTILVDAIVNAANKIDYYYHEKI